MNAVILGCGYVGKAVARLWQQTLTVTATTTSTARVAELEEVAQRAVVLKGNDELALRSLLQDQQLVLLSMGAPNANAYEETYLQTAKAVASVLRDTSSVKQIIYTGSYAVYGDQGGAWVDETTAIAPANRNGEILAATEQALLDAASDDLKVCVLRLGGIYGPNREIIRIFRGAAGTTRPGNGEDASNWVHLDDIVGAIDFARRSQLQGIYNLVCNVPLSTRELLEQLFTRHNLPAVTWDASQSSTRPYNARVSNQKLKDAGYEFIYPKIMV